MEKTYFKNEQVVDKYFERLLETRDYIDNFWRMGNNQEKEIKKQKYKKKLIHGNTGEWVET